MDGECELELVKTWLEGAGGKGEHSRAGSDMALEAGTLDGADRSAHPFDAGNKRSVELTGIEAKACFEFRFSTKGCSVPPPERMHGKVRIVGTPPIQCYHGHVPVVNEDVGASLDGSHGRTGNHFKSHAVVTVHHAANDLDLQKHSRKVNQPPLPRWFLRFTLATAM